MTTEPDDFDAAVETLRGALRAQLVDLTQWGETHIPRVQLPMVAGPNRPTAPGAPAPGVAAPAPAPEAVAAQAGGPADKLRLLQAESLGECTRCKLHRGRTHIVFGVGNPEADLVFVGEGPGADEDRQGIPFVGRAGQLLTKMIKAMGHDRDDVYICNVVKCRPPNNRDPEPEEVAACEPFLKGQLSIIQPRVIVGMGRYACQTLLHTSTSISRLRGRWQTYEGVDFMPTFHPAYLLRSPEKKRDAWSDLQQVMRRLSAPTAPRG